MTVMLDQSQWNDPPPECPMCSKSEMAQDIKPVAIGGSVRSKAEKITQDILENDYGVTNVQRDKYEPVPKVDYAGPHSKKANSTWGVAREALEAAVTAGRQTRIRHGTGLDILQANLKSGAEPDLIELSKRRAMRIY
jgi:hypothetical protein